MLIASGLWASTIVQGEGAARALVRFSAGGDAIALLDHKATKPIVSSTGR